MARAAETRRLERAERFRFLGGYKNPGGSDEVDGRGGGSAWGACGGLAANARGSLD